MICLTWRLVDNDLKGGKVEFTADSAQVKEDEGEVTVAVRRVGGSRGQASVAYSTRSIDANSGEDYQPVQGVLSWAHQDVAVVADLHESLRDAALRRVVR